MLRVVAVATSCSKVRALVPAMFLPALGTGIITQLELISNFLYKLLVLRRPTVFVLVTRHPLLSSISS